jgi:AraC-like DNA-binding protein
MHMLKSRFRLVSLKRNSFFVKLLSAFLVMIVLLLSFNVLSFTFFKTNVHDDIIKYNSLELTKTMDGYEKHIKLLKSDLVTILLSQSIVSVMNNGDTYDLLTVTPAMKDIHSLLSSQLLYLDSLIVYSPTRTYTVENNVTGTTSDLFVTRYASSEYPLAFWKDQLKQRYGFHMFPAATFKTQSAYSNDYYPIGRYFPIIVKNYAINSVMMVAFLDADALYSQFQVNDDNPFYILDEDGKPLFESKPGLAIDAHQLPDGTNHTIINGQYYFYEHGSETNYTYVVAVPIAHVNSSISHLTYLLVAILLASLILGLVVSVILSIRFHSPIRRVIEGLQNEQSPTASPEPSKIYELDWISQTVNQMKQVQEAIHSDLDRKNAQLKHYRYLNQIKRMSQGRETIEPESPFYLVLFHIAFRDPFYSLTASDQEKATKYLMEYVNLSLSGSFKDIVTLQVEQHQFLSLLFTGEPAGSIVSALQQLKEVFDRDKEYCLLTIAFLPEQRSSSELAAHYEATAELLSQRTLNASTQIIAEMKPLIELTPMTPLQEQELTAALQSGEANRPIELISLCLEQLSLKGAGAPQLYAFAKEVIAKVLRAMVGCNLEIGSFVERHNPYDRLTHCASLDELRSFLSALIRDSSQQVQEQKAQQDPIKDFVMNYVQHHYNQDISLESAARRLNMSRNYLSTYFREKTGMTFTDYLNTFRIARAKELLSVKDIQIQEVATQIGYLNTNSFIRMFKKISGMTPGEYRRSLLLGDEDA